MNNRALCILASIGLTLAAQCLAEPGVAEQAIPALIQQAESALAQGQPQQAAELYEKAAGLGESAVAETGLVRAYLQAGEFRKTIAFSNLVASEHPDVSETAALLAYLEDREGQTAPALAKLDEERKKYPEDAALLGAHAEILIDRLAIPQAVQQLDGWIGRNPPHGDIYRLRARAALAAGNREDLIKWRGKAAQAYEAKGELAAAKPLREWLSKQAGAESTAAAETIQAAANGEIPTARWPAAYQESFPPAAATAVKSGNGFVVDQGRRVITNASLVSATSGEVLVRNGLGKVRKSKVEKILPDQGLALLRLETPYPKAWSLPNQSFAVPDGVRFCFVLGFPVTDALETAYPILAPGVVVRPDAGVGGLMQITGSLGPDNSGSPVFDGSGKLIGLTLAKQEPLKGITDRDAMLGKGAFAVRADALQKLLPSAAKPGKKPAKALTPKTTPSVEELYEKLLPSVVTIVAPD